MGKLLDRLEQQLKTDYKQDAEDCIQIYNKIKEVSNGRVWESDWRPLVNTIFKGFPSDERRFKPTTIGYVFLKGLKNHYYTS
jgi:acyl carrier protein phosphodiesterase